MSVRGRSWRAHPAFAELEQRWGEVRRLQSIEALLSWDQETGMPPAAADDRSEQLSTVATLIHDRLAGDALSECVERAAAVASAPLEVRMVQEARGRVARARAIPRRLAGELAAAGATGAAAWQRARAAQRMDELEPALGRLVELHRELAAALFENTRRAEGEAWEDPYETLLEEHEPGARVADLDRMFSTLLAELEPRARELPSERSDAAAEAVTARFPLDRQLEVGRRVVAAVGFDGSRGRLDASAHPFCISLGAHDIRITWRAAVHDLRPGLFGFLHEAGHATYEQGLPADLWSTPLGGAASLGIHESQSRLWENLVGRSRGFCQWLWGWLPDLLPGLPYRDADALWRHCHQMARGPIRVDADQATYDLHIVVRYRLERELLSGALEVGDLEAAWNDAYRRHLGIDPPDAGRGVLQDIHWAVGLFGYFPTYTLGNLAASQLFEAAGRDLGPLDRSFADGDFLPLLDWLRDRVHRHAATLSSQQLIERATGRALDPGPFLRHLDRLLEGGAVARDVARAPA